MGLMDVLNGMQNGPRGQRDPRSSSGGMSPITMAILGCLLTRQSKELPAVTPQSHLQIHAKRRAETRSTSMCPKAAAGSAIS